MTICSGGDCQRDQTFLSPIRLEKLWDDMEAAGRWHLILSLIVGELIAYKSWIYIQGTQSHVALLDMKLYAAEISAAFEGNL